MEDGQATAGLVFEPQGRESSFALHQKMQGKELNPQHPVRMFLELLGLNLHWAQLLVCPQDASNPSPMWQCGNIVEEKQICTPKISPQSCFGIWV